MVNTISDELNRLIQAKADIKSALEEKGLTIGDSSTLDEFPGLIQEMEVGGGGGSDTSVLIGMIQGDIGSKYIVPNGVTTINSEIQIGGLNLQLGRPIADIFSNIDVGGINSGDYQQISDVEFKGNEFDSSNNKLIVHNNIRLGGVNTQSFSN